MESTMKSNITETALDILNKGEWIPKELLEEGVTGVAIAPSSVIPSFQRTNLEHLYQMLEKNYSDKYNIQWAHSHIVIYPKAEGEKPGFDYQKYSQAIAQNMLESKQVSEDTDTFDYVKAIASMIEFFISQGVCLDPLPEIILNGDVQEGDELLTNTGSYSPEDNVVVIYTHGRHPKDVCRTCAHELYHHSQNLSNKIGETSDRISENKAVEDIESECYQKSNILFRKWTEQIKENCKE